MKHDHAFRERQSLALNGAVARRLSSDPRLVLERARRTLARWKSMPGVWCIDLATWERILDIADVAEVHRLLTGTDEFAIRLRQSSPFSVQLSPRERWRILRESPPA
ncbi:MAG: hypothetical protein A3H35_20840 [Betaproteobacteria bacterium RIFCSPLOWO2_02_FULL_62_17]|nr:MAG: hypothetical protein A3H35_20840 [Betaproteobacteria bacterium RIFCSPLOWO2_02_FULL_62_17]